ncbi:late control protein D [Ochrobactrum pecoris]|nr:late control protein D [Brucella pecoris]MBB4092475.1 hypothetical protein [Brucella pecoris]NKW80384.1 late control protein D [Brucella pecoris]
MTITDGVGTRSDTLSIVLDDIDGSIAAPKTGAVLNPIGGYEGQMRDFGLFSVDSVVFTGWPQQIQIQAKSVAAKSLTKQREPKAYPKKDFPTYGDIFADIAGRVGLSLSISDGIKATVNVYEAQTEESSVEFMTRIGEKLNASVSVKAGHVAVVARGDGKSATGAFLPDIIVARGKNLLSYSVTEKDEPKHSKVEASYYDRKKNKKETVEVSTGLEGPTFSIRVPLQDKDEAERRADSEAKKLQRSAAEASFEINGEPFAQAGANVIASGCRSNVDGAWLAETVTHNFSASGAYKTSISCKKPNKSGSGSGKNGSSSSSASAGKTNPAGSTPRSTPQYEAGVPSLTGDPGSNIG